MSKDNHKVIFIVFCFICFFTSLKSQPALDTIKYSLLQKPVLFGKFGTRNSFINNNRAEILGVQLGLNYGNYTRFGIGYNQLYSSSSAFDKQFYFANSNNKTDTVNAKLKLWYFSVFAEYIYYQNNKWKYSIPLQLGVGQGYYQYNLNNEKNRIDENLLFVYEPAVSVEYKIVKWVGVGVDIGFRFIITNYKQLNEKLNSPTYAFKLVIYYNEIYKSLMRKG